MTRTKLSISAPHHQALLDCLFPSNRHEAGAIILCGVSDVLRCPWDSCASKTFVTKGVIPIPAADVVSSSSRHYEWRKRTFLKAYRTAREEGLAIGFVHSHRGVHAFFSNVDDQSDHELAELVSHRQSPRPDVLSLVMDEDQQVVGRQLLTPWERRNLDRVLVYGRDTWQAFSHAEIGEEDPAFARQLLAFGPEFLDTLKLLRISIAGAGATGSAVLALLMRLGARFIASIDPQNIDLTNTTRIHGSSRADALAEISKVLVAKRSVELSGFDVDFKPYQHFVTDAEVRDVLKASDLIIGCTDDHEGRLFLNRFAYFYNTPLIDMGIRIDPQRVRENHVRMADGRVTVVSPGQSCLVCRGIVDPAVARDEHLRRTDPKSFGERLAEGYIAGQFVTAPSVITLTTAIACQAVDELTARLTGYRGPADHVLRKFVARKDFSPGPRTMACGVCGDHSWGRGDVTPFLDRVA